MANLALVYPKGVSCFVFLVAMGAANSPTLCASICRLYNFNAVGGNFRAWHKMTAYVPSSPGTGAFGASEIHQVRLPLWDFPFPEACLDTVIVLVTLTGAALLCTSGTTGALLENGFNAVLQNWTVHTCAVSLAETYVHAQKHPT